jgi:hypothetical protein
MTTSEDQLLIDAMNARVRRQRSREARQAREIPNSPRWSPPRCAQCRQRPADIEERDYTPDRPFFCSKECFRAFRDHLHGFRGRLKAPFRPRQEKTMADAQIIQDASTAVCERVEGFKRGPGGLPMPDLCGEPADPKSQSVAGEWLCPYHLEQWCGKEMI